MSTPSHMPCAKRRCHERPAPGDGRSPGGVIGLAASEVGALIGAGEISAVEVAQAHLDRIEAVDADVKAFLHVDRDGALKAAAQVDRRRADGETLGPLAGVPLAMKDVVVTEGVPTTAGSKILQGWVPPWDATISQRIKAAGIVMLGKTNMDEFAMGSSTENSAYFPTHNPWDLSRIPGGSSGGSSAAVAAYEAPLSIGTDTGGSIRQPAAVTGIVGHKPTYGAVSRNGLIAFSSSLDQAGPFGRTVLDAALLHATIAGHDEMDSTSIPQAGPDVVAAAREGAQQDLRGMRDRDGARARRRGLSGRRAQRLPGRGRHAGRSGRRGDRGQLPALRVRAGRVLPDRAERMLVQPGPLRLGPLRTAGRRRRSRSLEEVMSETREAGFGAEVKRRIIIGTYALSSGYYEAYYGQAQKVRTLISRRLHPGVRAVRRAGLADLALRGVQDR